MSLTEIDTLLRTLDEWEAADDRASEASAVLRRRGPMTPTTSGELRTLQGVAKEKLEALRRVVVTEL